MKKWLGLGFVLALCLGLMGASYNPGGSAGSGTDWTQDQGATNIHAGNIPDLSSTYLTPSALTTTLGAAYDTEAELQSLFAGKQASDADLTFLATYGPYSTGTLGGTTGMLDAIPVASCADGMYRVVSTTGGKLQIYYYESSSAADEADNSVIKPDDNAGNGRWLIQLWIESGVVQFASINLPSSNADPSATAGQIRHDSPVSNHANGAVRWHDGSNIRHGV